MKFNLELAKYILSMAMLAGVTTTLAEPIFNVYSNSNRDKTGNYYLCDQHNTGDLRIVATNMDSENIGNINVEIYTSASDVGNSSKAVATYTNEAPSDINFTVERSEINPGNQKTQSQTYYVKITPADGSAGSWTEEITFDAIHVNDVTPPKIEPYCSGNMPASANNFIMQHMSSNYHWYDANDNPIGMLEFLRVSALPEGNHLYKMQVKQGSCYSMGIEIILPVMGNSAPHLNQSYVTYTSADISNGAYTKSIYEQAMASFGTELVDNPNNCDLKWKDKSGNVISNFDSYIPPVPTTFGTTIDQYTVTKDCGCGAAYKTATLYLLRYVVPTPKVDNKEFCVDDPRATDGFDAIIGLTDEPTESANNYILEFSKNPDMSDATALTAGATHFDYAFDASTAGTTTYYVRQQQVSSKEYSEVVPFDVVVKQPEAPVIKDVNICANTIKTLPLSVGNQENIIWKDSKDDIISGIISTEIRGDISLNAQQFELVNGKQCLSQATTVVIHADSLDVAISGDKILLPGQTGKAELAIKGSENAKVVWSCNVSDAIVGDADKNEVNIKMGASNVTLTATVTDGVCSQSVDWTISADLFQCPAPSADDITLCLNDPHAADGFDANITLENNSDSKSNYTLSVSPNASMSRATTLAPGETHFDYAFDASEVGIQTVYIQQTEITRNLTSAIIPVKITVGQPTIPSTTTTAICLNNQTEVMLSELSSDANLQWFDANKSELTSTASFNKSGTHPLYVKRYEIVNGEKCWSELTSVNVTADSIGIKVNGDNHLCPNSEGKVTIEGTTASFVRIQWDSDYPNSISNASAPTVDVKMSNSDLTLSYTVTSGVCKTTGTWEITVGTGKVAGKIQFTEGSKTRNFNKLENTQFVSCGGKISVEATIEHTSTDFTVLKGSQKLGTYSFAVDVAKFDVEGAGTYTVVYSNDCETSFTFDVTIINIQPEVKTTKWSSCYDGYIAAEISNVDGCSVVWKKDGTEIAKETKALRVNNVSANNIGNYTYELVCDGCPADGIVSATQPDIYSPLTVAIEQSADTICQGDEVEVNIVVSPNSDKASFAWATGNDMSLSNSGASATLKPYTTKSYNVIIRNGDCPSQTKTINVSVQPQMNGNIQAGSIMCEGDSTEIDASSLEAERYEWEHDNSTSPVITVVPNGVENIYTVTAYRGKCVLEKDFTLMVGATPKLASIDSIGLDDVVINMESDGDYQFIVDGKDAANDVADNVKKHVGFGKHTLSIIDIAGCKTDTSFTVITPPFELQSYFVPGSDGENSTFRIPDAVIVYPGTTMNIFDRWGKKLATLTSEDSEGWDGTYNGKPMPSSDYWYELNVDVIDKVYVGHFTLIRE